MPLSPNGGWPKPTSGPFRRVRVPPSGPQIGPGTLGQTAVAVQDLVELMLFQLLQIQQGVVSPCRSPQQLVQLDLHRLGIPILSGLNEEYHQEGDDRRTGIDDQLPGITEMK